MNEFSVVRVKLFSVLTMVLLGLGIAAVGGAQVVVLNPAVISGRVEVGSEPISRLIVTATATEGSDSAILAVDPPAGSTSVDYSLTVNVPEGTVQTYEVRTEARTDDGRDKLFFPTESVAVTEFETSTVDFVLADPGFVEGTVIVTGGGTLESAGISVDGAISDATSQATGAGDFRLPVLPQDGLTLFCNATLVGGAATSRRIRNLEVAAGETLIADCELPTPIADAILFGTVAMPGPLTPQRHQVQVFGRFNQFLTADGPYAFELAPGTGPMTVQTRFNNSRQSFNHPRGSFDPLPLTDQPRYSLDAGETLQVDVSSAQAFVSGDVIVTGPPSLPSRPFFRSVRASGLFGTSTAFGSATDQRNSPPEDYQLVLTEGTWDVSELFVIYRRSTSDTATYLDSRFVYTDAVAQQAPLAISAIDPGTRDFELALGEVIVTFRTAPGSGLVLSDPSLIGNCAAVDMSGTTLSSYNLTARDPSTQKDVEVGRVRFFGPGGTCTLTARARVDGTTTTFGDVSVDVIPGTTVVVDNAAPTLTVENPEPDLATTDGTVTVSGIATDDVAVASVTVNGVEADLVATGNPADPAERSFSVTIALESGPNTIVTVATDTADPANATSDSRVVTLVNQPPTADAGEDRTVELESPAGASVTLDGSGSSDPDDDPLTYAWSGPFGTATGPMPTVLLPAGSHEVTLVVNDGTVDSPSDTVIVTVRDTMPPSFTKTQLETELWPPNHQMVLVATVSGLEDLVDPDPAVAVVVTSNQPIDGPGDGNTETDWQVERSGDTWSIWVRAERAGGAGDRVYTIETTATDAAGNAAAERCTVTVPSNRR